MVGDAFITFMISGGWEDATNDISVCKRVQDAVWSMDQGAGV